MKNFFEVNLPSEVPHMVQEKDRQAYKAAVQSITTRTDKLNEALDISQLEPNKFHLLMADFFKGQPDLFDQKSADELAALAVMLDDGEPVKVKRLDWPNATVLFDTAFTSVKEWESLRHIGIGGSEAGVVMGVSPYTTPKALYHSKIGTEIPGAKEKSQVVLDRGHMVESRVVEAFCRVAGMTRIPESRMFASKEYPHSTANIDAILQSADGKIYIFEAKTAVEESRGKWTSDKVPRHYLEQTHQYPAVLDDDRICGTYISCMFTVDYSSKDYFITATFDAERNITRFIERNETAEQALLEQEDYFWNEYIALNEEPVEEGNAAMELEFSKELAGDADPKEKFIELPKNDLALIEDYLALDAKRKEVEEKLKGIKTEMDAIKAPLIEHLAQEVEGHIQLSDTEYAEVRFAPVKESPKCDLEALAFGFPEAYKSCVSPGGEGARRFSLKKRKFKKH